MWCRSAERLARIESKLDALALMMTSQLEQENAMAVDLAQIQADVGKNADVVQSAVTLLSGLKSQIDDLKTKVSSDPQSQAAIAALSQSLEAQSKNAYDRSQGARQKMSNGGEPLVAISAQGTLTEVR